MTTGKRMPSGGHADRWGFSLASIVLIILVWLLLTETGLVKGRFFASPVTVAHEFWVLLTDGYAGVPLLHHVGISLLRALAGLLLALVIGVPVGLIIGWSAVASSLLSPALTMFRPVPPIALIPLAVLWFGIG